MPQRGSASARYWVAALVTIAASACSPTPAMPQASTPRAAESTQVGPTEAQLATWQEFRRLWGLPFDAAWMEQVASIPRSADNDFEVPLTVAEIDQIGQAITDTDELVTIIRRYGASHPEGFGGVFIEGRTVVLLMKGRVENYAEDVRNLVPAGAPVEVRAASYTVPELEAKATGILRDDQWFVGQRLEVEGAEASADGHVQLRYRGGVGEEADLISAHYGRPDWLEVSWAGPAQWKGPVGTVRLTVRDQNGRPVADASCIVQPVDPSISYEPGVAFTTNAKGVCRLPNVPAVRVDAQVWLQEQPVQEAPAGHARTTVPPEHEVPITVVLGPMP